MKLLNRPLYCLYFIMLFCVEVIFQIRNFAIQKLKTRISTRKLILRQLNNIARQQELKRRMEKLG